MALSLGRRKLRGETGGHGSRCRHFHVHYHLPRRRAYNFSLRRWLPRLSLLFCVLIPLALFLAVLAFVVSFVWFTLLYFVASLLHKDSDHESFKNGSFGRASGSDVDNPHRGEDGVREGKREAKGKAVKHAAELLTGDSATAETAAQKLEIKEVHIDGFSEVSQNITRIASSDGSLDREVCINNDRVLEELSIFVSGREGVHANADLVPVDGFMDEHNIRVISRSTSGDSLPSVCSINSVPDMNEVIEMSSDFLVGSNQNMVVPSNTSSPHSSDTNEEYGEEFLEDRKELSDCTPSGIIDFIDKHETRDQVLDGSFAKDEIVGLLTTSDGSPHGIILDEHNKESTEEKDTESVPELLIDCVTNLEHFDEQRVHDVLIIEANTNQSVPASNEVHDFCNNDETSVLPLYFVETIKNSHKRRLQASIDEEAGVCPLSGKKIKNSIVEASNPASTACDFVENHKTATRALGDSVNGNSTGVVASRGNSEEEADKVNDDSTPEGARRGRPLLKRSPSQWWKLCGVVDVFAGSEN